MTPKKPAVTPKRAAILAAVTLAEDIDAGKVGPDQLDAELVGVCRSLFGTVGGPEDALWELHIDVTRQTLAAGGLTADELSEWAAVIRRRAGETPDTSSPPDDTTDEISAVSVAHSPEIGDHDGDPSDDEGGDRETS